MGHKCDDNTCLGVAKIVTGSHGQILIDPTTKSVNTSLLGRKVIFVTYGQDVHVVDFNTLKIVTGKSPIASTTMVSSVECVHNATNTSAYQDLVYMTGNSSDIALAIIDGITGDIHGPCTILKRTDFAPQRVVMGPSARSSVVLFTWLEVDINRTISGGGNISYVNFMHIPFTWAKQYVQECPEIKRPPENTTQLFFVMVSHVPISHSLLSIRTASGFDDSDHYMVLWTNKHVLMLFMDLKVPVNNTWPLIDFRKGCELPPEYKRGLLYCAPDTEDIVFAQTFNGDVLESNPPVWLLLTIRSTATNASKIKLISIDEFRSDKRTGRTKGTPFGNLPWDPACNMNTQYTNYGVCVESCCPRAEFNFDVDSPITAGIEVSPVNNKALQGVPNSIIGSFDNFTAVIPNHYILAVPSGSNVHILALILDKVYTLEKFNTIAFTGKSIINTRLSPNAQHLLVAVERYKWEIDATMRFFNICTALQNDPNDPFLAPMKEDCEKFGLNYININTFTQYVSYCTTGTHCPHLSTELIGQPRIGWHIPRPSIMRPCDPGNFCTQGQKQQCPPGFTCPNPGMHQPERCSPSTAWDKTCYGYSLVRPQPCPAGLICNLAHFPGTPAPPGMYTTAGTRRRLYPCRAGDHCPIGRSNITLDGKAVSLLCPAMTYCTEQDKIRPSICQCENGQMGPTPCPTSRMIPYCPSGTQIPGFCPPGNYCSLTNETFKCLPTQYCPSGTVMPDLCDGGKYCPSPGTSIECPQSSYCPKGSVYPIKCGFLALCPPGSVSPQRSVWSLVWIGVLILIIVGVWKGYAYWRRLKLAKNAQRSLVEMKDSIKGDITVEGPAIPAPYITFKGMGLELQVGDDKGRVVLKNITGTIDPGSFVAVMGPSGSGKSTFLHTLAGKAFYGKRHGTVLMSNDALDLQDFRRVIGFVKQDDIMHRDLTVRENLMFCSRSRNVAGSDYPRKKVEEALTLMDLGGCQNTLIGDETRRGVSGGQRKRVNIGMELVSNPSILFLDEPTSGLDSASSMLVCRAMRELAAKGMTVIAVIHQPRYEIFTMFHKVLLLAKGGGLVYYGATDGILPYVENWLGYACPQHVNPADHMMDVVSGEVSSESNGYATPEWLEEKWVKYMQQKQPEKYVSLTGGAAEGGDNGDSLLSSNTVAIPLDPINLGGSHRGSQLSAMAKARPISSVVLQLWLFLQRAFVQQTRNMIAFFVDLCLVLIAGAFLGMVFSKAEYEPPLPSMLRQQCLSGIRGESGLSAFLSRPLDDPIISEASLSCMAIGMTGVMAALRVFGNEKVVYWREASNELSPFAYFLAKNLMHLPFVLIAPFLYLSMFMSFASFRASIQEFYRVLVVIEFTTVGLGYLISIVAPPTLAQLSGVVTVLVFSMFGGARPTLVEIRDMVAPLRAMPYISYVRWGQEAFYLEEIYHWNVIKETGGNLDVQAGMDLFDYHLDHYWYCMLILFGFGMLFRVLAFIALVVMDRKQKL